MTAKNFSIAYDQVVVGFKIKAYQFISSQDERAASRFVDQHAASSPQEILDALAAWNPDVVPYMQDLPYRVQGVMLQALGSQGSFWEGLERQESY